MPIRDGTPAETLAETLQSAKDPRHYAETEQILQSFGLQLKTLEMNRTRDESFLKRHATLLSVVGFALLAFFAWYQQTQDHTIQISLLDARTSTLEKSITGDEDKSLAVESRLTRLETKITDFADSQQETNREIKKMVRTLLMRSTSEPD